MLLRRFFLLAAAGLVVPLVLPLLAAKAAPIAVRPGTVNIGAGRTQIAAPLALSTYSLLGGRATLEKCQSTAISALTKPAGTCTLALKVRSAGRDYTLSFPNSEYYDLTADSKGAVTAGKVTVGAAEFPDFLGTGMALHVASGTGGLVPVRGGSGLELSILSKLTTAFRSGEGTQYDLAFERTPLRMYLDAAGGLALDGVSGVAPGLFTGALSPFGQPHFLAGGMDVAPSGAVSLSFKALDAALPAYSMTCSSGTAGIGVPGIVAEKGAGLALRFADLVVNESGEVTAKSMGIPQGQASLVALASPAGFALNVTRADVTLERSEMTRFTVQSDLYLPETVTDDKGGRVCVTGLNFDMLRGSNILDFSQPAGSGSFGASTAAAANASNAATASASALTSTTGASLGRAVGGVVGVQFRAPLIRLAKSCIVNFNGFRAELNDLIIDLSPVGPEDSSDTPGVTGKGWQGVYAKSANITLPMGDWSTADGKAATMPATNCFIDTNGFTGRLDAGADKLQGVRIKGGFDASLTELHLTFGRNSIITCSSKGSASVKGFDGELTIDIKVTNTDTTALVSEASQLSHSGLGVALSVRSGKVFQAADGTAALWLDGSMSISAPKIPSLSGCDMGFHGLGISGGAFVTTEADGWLSFDAPATADMGALRCIVSSCAFQKQSDGKWRLLLGGEYSLNSDLPVSGMLNCDPVQIVEGAAGKPDIVVGDVGVSAEMFGIAKAAAVLKAKDTGSGFELRGEADLALLLGGDAPFMKDPSSPTAPFEFLVSSKGYWAVAGQVVLPASMEIPLGTTGLSLYKFTGGIARNMTADGKGFDSVDSLKPTNSPSWLFSAGIGVAASGERFLFHADGKLGIELPAGDFSLNADGWFMTEDDTPPGMVTVDIAFWPGIPAFSAQAGVDIGIPDPSILRAWGGMEFYAAPGDVHINIGWPYPEQAVQCDILGGVITARFGSSMTLGSYQFRAGASFDYWVFKGSIEGAFEANVNGNPYLSGSVWASGEVDFWIVSLGASASLTAALYQDYLHLDGTFSAEVSTPWPLPDISVSVHFETDIS